jgi:hypothetical protein
VKNPFEKLFGRRGRQEPSDEQRQEPLVITPMPPLVVLLLNLEEAKGAPLTETEVLEARDKAICIALPASKAAAIAQARGYQDIDLDDAWPDWLNFKSQSGA